MYIHALKRMNTFKITSYTIVSPVIFDMNTFSLKQDNSYFDIKH